MTRSRKLLLLLPLLAAIAALAAQDQDPAAEEIVARVRMAELQYTDQAGTLHAIPASTIVQVRLFSDSGDRMLLEVYYENGDYTMLQPQSFSVIRKGSGAQEVQLVRTTRKRALFPAIP